MAESFRMCQLCFHLSMRHQILLACGHSICRQCMEVHYGMHHRTSVMRTAAIPCPLRSCRTSSRLPSDVATDFRKNSSGSERRILPEPLDDGSRKQSEPKPKRKVTFSFEKEGDYETQHEELGSESLPSANPRKFRSTVKLSIRRIVAQQEVDVPDSAFVPDLDPVAPPDTWTGTYSVIDRKKFGETRFVFPSVSSIDNRPEFAENGTERYGNEEKEAERKASVDVTDEMPFVEESLDKDDNNNSIEAQPHKRNTKSKKSPAERGALEATLAWVVSANVHQKPTSIALTSHGTAVVANYGKGCLQYLDGNGHVTLTVEHLKPFTVLVMPTSALQSTSGSIAVGDRRGKTLVFLEALSGEILSQWEPGCFDWVGGLGVLRNGNLVVSDRASCCVGVYTPEGLRVAGFGSYGTGDDNICMADYLTVDSRDRVIISDSANHCIKIFDPSGTFLAKLSGRGSSDGLLSWPKGVCVDQMDNIIVADSKNGRLSMFSPTGRFVQNLISDVPCPYGVCYQEPETVATTHYSLSGYSQCATYRLK